MADTTKRIEIKFNNLHVDRKLKKHDVSFIRFLKDGDVMEVTFQDGEKESYDMSNETTMNTFLDSLGFYGKSGVFLKNAKHIMDVYDRMPQFIKNGLWTKTSVVKMTICKYDFYVIKFKAYCSFKRDREMEMPSFVFTNEDDANVCVKLFDKQWQFSPSKFINYVKEKKKMRLYDINNLSSYEVHNGLSSRNRIQMQFTNGDEKSLYCDDKTTNFIERVLRNFCEQH